VKINDSRREGEGGPHELAILAGALGRSVARDEREEREKKRKKAGVVVAR